MSNIIQEFLLKKQKFNFNEGPPCFYWRDTEISPELSARVVVIFKEYEIVLAKYLVYNNNYYALEILPETKKYCKTVLEVFDFIKGHSTIDITTPLINDSLIKITNKIIQINQDSTKLVSEITGLQRSLCVFEAKSNDSKMIKDRLNRSQKKLNKFEKEITLLKEIKKILSYPIV